MSTARMSEASNCRGNLNQVNLQSVPVKLLIPLGRYGIGDVVVNLPVATKRVMICSIGPTQSQETYGLFLHFQRMGIDYSVTFVPSGTEGWIQLHTPDIANTVFMEGTILEFPDPITTFLIDVAGTGNTAYNICFGCVDGFKIEWKPQASTSA